MADFDYSIEETTPVMDDEKMLCSISSTCQVLTLASSTVTKSLGRSLLTSTKRDISLEEHCKNENLEYFKFPHSLRACLVQVSIDVCDAFDAAHRSMKRISVNSEYIVADAKSALQLMEEGTHQGWEIALHYLYNAEESCLECAKKAASVMEQLEEIGKTIDELYVVLYERSYEAKEEHEDAAPACPPPWINVNRKFLDGIPSLAINFAIESFKQKDMPLPQKEKKEEYDKCTTIPKKAKQESKKKASQDLEKFNQEIDDLNNVKDALRESMQKLYRINKFSRELNIMFQKFHDIIRECIEEKLSKALECGKKAKAMNEEHRDVIYDVIYVSRNAIKSACMVKWISKFYVEVSEKYLLVGVNGLQSITFLRSSSDHARMEEVWRKLEEDAKEAEREIPKIAEEREKDLRNELSQH